MENQMMNFNITDTKYKECSFIKNKYFDNNGEKIFDYGSRNFIARLASDLSIEIFNNKNKKIDKLPSPNKNDDKVQAKKSLKEYNQFKNVLYDIADVKEILEESMLVQKRYSIGTWTDCFLNNIIMKKFAEGLIWGLYYDEKFLYTFKAEGKGTFIRDNRKIYNRISDYSSDEFYENYNIRLVHPVDLSSDIINFWRNILKEEEINQPILQMDRKIFTIDEEDIFLEYVSRFQNRTIYKKNIGSRMINYNWYSSFIGRSDIFEFYREFKKCNIGAEADFIYNGPESEYLTFNNIKFYHIENVAKDGGQCYCLNASNCINPQDAGRIIFSEVLYEIDTILQNAESLNSN